MKYIKAILMLGAAAVAIAFPILAIVFGLVSTLIEKPDTFLQIAAYCAVVAAVTYGIYLLLKNPRTVAPTKVVLTILVCLAIFKSCTEGGSADCGPARYMSCD